MSFQKTKITEVNISMTPMTLQPNINTKKALRNLNIKLLTPVLHPQCQSYH